MADIGKWEPPSPGKDATQEVTDFTKQMRSATEKELLKDGKSFPQFAATKYRQQVIPGGMNYVVKVDIGVNTDQCVHVQYFVLLGSKVPTYTKAIFATGNAALEPLVK